MAASPITAAVLVIGDEILSGSIRDRNIGVIADLLVELGIDLREVRIVRDEQDDIVSAVNALRRRYSYLFTTGGLGPTHDDVTADSIAAAFGVGIDIDDRARSMLLERHKPDQLNAARLRMARVPAGADLIAAPTTKAPGFRLENVFVMAGIPEIMVAMLEQVRPLLKSSAPPLSRTVDADRIPEGVYADLLRKIAMTHGSVTIGSYPSMTREGFRNSIVVRGRDAGSVDAAAAAVETMLVTLRDDGSRSPLAAKA
ncbi:competence/damage-inducible protein A [Methylorubrum populi]|uniref:ADP-ribose pyrophosphatase n=1 Tax=Methylorubrum populi TaxID=223967 RepID=A0A833J012_9HYPH|nr:molybdopterin-binding protein [Methylorubrum populi]KAB7781973.1 ADP-ribose pyrophosphatase [Methylorubrum populi]